MFKKIMVCLDGTNLAEQMLEMAKEEAKTSHGKLVLVNVIPPPSAIVEPITGFYSATPIDKVLERENESESYLAHTAETVKKTKIEVEYHVLRGDAGQEIVKFAEENDVDLIVLSTHGRKGLGRLVFGSVAEHVLRNSSKPILIKKPVNA